MNSSKSVKKMDAIVQDYGVTQSCKTLSKTWKGLYQLTNKQDFDELYSYESEDKFVFQVRLVKHLFDLYNKAYKNRKKTLVNYNNFRKNGGSDREYLSLDTKGFASRLNAKLYNKFRSKTMDKQAWASSLRMMVQLAKKVNEGFASIERLRKTSKLEYVKREGAHHFSILYNSLKLLQNEVQKVYNDYKLGNKQRAGRSNAKYDQRLMNDSDSSSEEDSEDEDHHESYNSSEDESDDDKDDHDSGSDDDSDDDSDDGFDPIRVENDSEQGESADMFLKQVFGETRSSKKNKMSQMSLKGDRNNASAKSGRVACAKSDQNDIYELRKNLQKAEQILNQLKV